MMKSTRLSHLDAKVILLFYFSKDILFMATLQEQIQELNTYPSCAHVSPQKLASMFASAQGSNGSLELINLDNASDFNRKLTSLQKDGDFKMFIIKDNRFPSPNDSMILSESVLDAIHLNTDDMAINTLKQNWEVYYNVGGAWYSQNIRKYLRKSDDVPRPIRIGDAIIITLHNANVMDLFEYLVDMSTIDISGSLSTLERTTWEAYKYSLGIAGASDENTIRTMLGRGLLYASIDNANYYKIPEKILLRDYVVISNEHKPLPVFTGEFNSGNDCDKPGIYNKITLGRPAGSVSGETYTLITHPDGSQEVRSNTVAGKAFYRPTKMDEWVQLGIN